MAFMRAAAAVTAAIGYLALAAAGVAAQERRVVGNWHIVTERDRFTDQPRVLAVTAASGHLLAVRCFSGNLSVMLIEGDSASGPFQAGAKFQVMSRVDKSEVWTEVGTAVDQRGIQLDLPAFMFARIVTGKEVAFRVTNEVGSYKDWIFPLRRQKEALAPVADACGLK
ncbi:MAG TPA: hypothetical protein PL193_07800 [Xanthobacteraceae bacterium]|nr:hypothetical protein [Xanthobacteraceae bacterium]